MIQLQILVKDQTVIQLQILVRCHLVIQLQILVRCHLVIQLQAFSERSDSLSHSELDICNEFQFFKY